MNLVEDAWVPVRFLDGSWGRVSLAGLFDQARRIARVMPASAIQARAVERLVIAVAWRAGSCFRDGLDIPGVQRYLAGWRRAFDARVFCQYEIEPASRKGLGLDRLMLDSPSGRAPAGPLPAGQAALALLARMLFDPAGIRTGIVGDPLSSGPGRCRSMPIGPALLAGVHTAVVHGPSLAETIVWNLPDGRWGQEMAGPVWEDDKTRPRARYQPEAGLAGRVLVWPSRRLRLYHDQQGRVVSAMLANGDAIGMDGRLAGVEPHGLWRATASGKLAARRDDGNVWDVLMDRGGPAPIGLARLLEGRIAPLPATVTVTRIGMELVSTAAAIRDLIDQDLTVATHGLTDRLARLEGLEGLVERLAWARARLRAMLTRQDEQADCLARHRRRLYQELAPTVADWLAARSPLDTTVIDTIVAREITAIGEHATRHVPDGCVPPTTLIKTLRKAHHDAINHPAPPEHDTP